MKRYKYEVHFNPGYFGGPKYVYGTTAKIEEGLLSIYDTEGPFTVLNLRNVLWYTGEAIDEQPTLAE